MSTASIFGDCLTGGDPPGPRLYPFQDGSRWVTGTNTNKKARATAVPMGHFTLWALPWGLPRLSSTLRPAGVSALPNPASFASLSQEFIPRVFPDNLHPKLCLSLLYRPLLQQGHTSCPLGDSVGIGMEWTSIRILTSRAGIVMTEREKEGRKENGDLS